MRLQYNANKLHIEFHQKVAALRKKYEGNLEAMCQALNQSTHNNAYGRQVQNKLKSSLEVPFCQNECLEVKNKNANNVAVQSPPKVQSRTHRPESAVSSISQTDTNNNSTPSFWYRVFANSQTMLREIQIVDQPILQSLRNVKVKTDMSKLQSHKCFNFMLEFHFDENAYFTNSVLTKEYFVQINPSNSTKKSTTTPQVMRSQGCQIFWKPGMNVTGIEVRTLKSDKTKRSRKVVVKHYTKDSFFNFFNTPKCSENEVLTPKQKEELQVDYELGCHIKERIVPRAISYFLGEASDTSGSGSSATSASSSHSSIN